MPAFTVIESETLQSGIAVVFGSAVGIQSSAAVAGGCINQGRRLELTDGRTVFCKQNSKALSGMFLAEAQGLAALRSLCTRIAGPHVPAPLALVYTPKNQYLLLEWIESGRRSVKATHEFAIALAAMHSAVVTTGELPGYTPDHAKARIKQPVSCDAIRQHGFVSNNYIGSTPQINTWTESWVDFFAEHRLRYQLDLAARKGLVNSSMRTLADAVLLRLPNMLPQPRYPSLLHGDLWSGNIMPAANDKLVMIDPAVYLGHYEADLAMMELFGSPGSGFFDAYQQIVPIEPGYEDRRELYNLYHLLNHLNIFGGGYRESVMRILERFS